MNNKLLNDMIKYIEEHLIEEIRYKDLAKIVGVSEYSLQRIFVFITGISLSDYIKKRRLSKAYEDICNDDCKIIDIAFKYQYNSAPSFNRAFKIEFGITPTECRKNKKEYKTYPIQHFDFPINKKEFEFKIKNMGNIVLYCYHIKTRTHEDLLFEIRKLYNKLKNNDNYKFLNSKELYGIFLKDDNLYHYYIGTTIKNNELEKYAIKSGQYVEFKLLSNKQKDIVNFDKSINTQWILSTKYNANIKNKIEYYVDDKCYIYLPIE